MRFPHKFALLVVISTILSSCDREDARPDIADYQVWIAKRDHERMARKLETYLNQQGVGGIFPLQQLLRSDTGWKKCGAEPFAVPPETMWPNIVPTLRIIRDKVVPRLGVVEALSVFRSPEINRCIKGASQSYHMQFRAIDMRPAASVTREQLILKMCSLQYREGRALNMGLGIYGGTRFHVDAAGYRRWGDDHHSESSPCRS